MTAKRPKKKKGKKAGNGAAGAPAPPAPPPLNSEARADIIRECAAHFDEIDLQREGLNTLAGEQRQRLKDNGISAAEVNVARQWRKQQQKDEGKSSTFFDNLREAMRALGVGEQGSLFMTDDAGGETAGDGDGEDPRPRHLRTPAEGGTKAN